MTKDCRTAYTVIADDALGTEEFNVGLDEAGRVRNLPTDVSQFIRLDQCERYLRLRLHERADGTEFVYDFGVVSQSIPPLLSQFCLLFEEEVERTVAVRSRTVNFADGIDGADSRATDNERAVTHRVRSTS